MKQFLLLLLAAIGTTSFGNNLFAQIVVRFETNEITTHEADEKSIIIPIIYDADTWPDSLDQFVVNLRIKGSASGEYRAVDQLNSGIKNVSFRTWLTSIND